MIPSAPRDGDATQAVSGLQAATCVKNCADTVAPCRLGSSAETNVLRDVLPPGAKCYLEGDRPCVPMADVPKFHLAV